MTTPITAGHPVHFLDQNGNPYGIKQIANKPRVSSTPYGYDIAEGNISDHNVLHTFGYNDAIGDTIEDMSELGALVPVPASAIAMEADSGAAADAGTVESSGTATGGSTTTLVDTGATFQDDDTAVGDFVANDANGSYGIVGTI
jgi:hypothetical protein